MWLLLSFLTAVCTSGQDILSKRVSGQVSPYVTAWAVSFFSLPFLAVFFLWEKPVVLSAQFWPALLASTVILTVSSIFFFKSIENSDLSLTIPLLSFTPLLLLLTSPIMLGEFPRPWGIVGMVLIVSGSYVLFYHPEQEDILAPFRRLLKARGSRYMVIVAILYSIGANVDKIGMRNSSPLIWSIYLNAAVSFFLGVIMLNKVPDAQKQVQKSWPWLLGIGCCMALVMMFQMYALKLTIVPYVIAIKRTSIIMTSLWGVWFLKEKGDRQRVWAVALMVVGVFVISFSNS
ncbi:MAG: EamA family transporter [Candidatus Omnitrophica bacterium]|nr:EamA family transporter [Candidatus Omnitrophota bacterium]